VARPRCSDVRRLARGARTLLAAASAEPIRVPLPETEHPAEWSVAERDDTLVPDGSGSIVASATVERAAGYEVWLGGSVRSTAELFVDGEAIGEVRHQLNNSGQYVSFGELPLEAGEHRIELRFAGAGLHPGSGGGGLPVGPIALTRAEAADSRIVRVRAAEAETLCNRAWDWIEVLG
jgi:hypothetical protein